MRRALAVLIAVALPRVALAQVDAGPPGNGMLVEPTMVSLGEVAPNVERTGEVVLVNTDATVVVNVAGVNQPSTPACAAFRIAAPAPFPIAMQPAQRDTWTVAVRAATLGHHECRIDFLDDDGNPDFVTLSADVVAPVMTVQPAMIGFGDVAVGGSADQRISISNDGTAPLVVSAITPSGSAEFSVMGPPLPRTITPRTTEILTVTYRPGAAGADTGAVTITGDDPSHRTATVALSGNGVAVNVGPHIVVSPDPIALGSVLVGAGADATLDVANDGGQPAAVSRIEIIGPNSTEMSIEAFGCTATQRCDTSQTIAAGGRLSVPVRCRPGYPGSKSAAIVITSTASNSPTSAAMSCTGTAADIAVHPATLGFGTVRVGNHAALTAQIENDGNARLDYTITRIGAGGGDYTVSPPCTSTCRLEPGASATHTVTFRPSAIGDRNGSLMISSNDPIEPARALTLTGVGGGGVLTLVSPVSGTLPFGDIPVGSTSSPQPVRIRNDGNLALRISSFALSASAAFALTGQVTPPDIVLAPGRTHPLDVTCSPSSATTFAATLGIVSDAPTMPQRTVALSCRGIMADLAATPAPVLFPPTRVGASAVEIVTVRNTGNTSTTISQLAATPAQFALENAPALPLGLAPNASFTVAVRFAPDADGDVEGGLTVTPQSGEALTVGLRGPGRVASFAIDPPHGDLGSVCQGQSIVQRFTLTSTGTADIAVQRPVLDGGGGVFTLTMIDPLLPEYPATLAPNETATIDVTAMPRGASATGALRIGTDVMPGGGVEIPLAIASIVDGVAVSPGGVAFGAVAVGDRSEPSGVSLSNCNREPLQVLDLDITGPDADAFDVGGTVPPPAITVPVASSIRWTTVFTPKHAGAHSATLTITHAGGSLTVPLTGEGQSLGPDAGPGPSGDGGASLDPTSYYACSCRSAGSPAGGALVVLALALALRPRRRAS